MRFIRPEAQYGCQGQDTSWNQAEYPWEAQNCRDTGWQAIVVELK